MDCCIETRSKFLNWWSMWTKSRTAVTPENVTVSRAWLIQDNIQLNTRDWICSSFEVLMRICKWIKFFVTEQAFNDLPKVRMHWNIRHVITRKIFKVVAGDEVYTMKLRFERYPHMDSWRWCKMTITSP